MTKKELFKVFADSLENLTKLPTAHYQEVSKEIRTTRNQLIGLVGISPEELESIAAKKSELEELKAAVTEGEKVRDSLFSEISELQLEKAKLQLENKNLSRPEILKVVWSQDDYGHQIWEIYDPAVHTSYTEYMLCQVVPEIPFSIDEADWPRPPKIGDLGYTIENYFVKVLAVVPIEQK